MHDLSPLFSTSRLHVRFLRSGDAAVVAEYRGDPEIARYQTWDLPYTIERALTRLRPQDDLTAIAAGTRANLGVLHDGELIGDLFVRVSDDDAEAEIGFTLRREVWGSGFATEAAGALVDHLLERTQINRITASLDSTNVRSMRVLEAIGMEFECLARNAVLVRGEWEDDLRYAMTRAERSAWRDRTVNRIRPGTVSLIELTDANALDVLSLRTHHSQERLVAPMAKSFAQALVPPIEPDGSTVVPWYRGIEADGEIVGFVMLSVGPSEPHPYLWRLLIDRRHQRRGIGERAVQALFAHLRSTGATEVSVSWMEGPGSPRRFYERLGFVPVGERDGETVGHLTFR